jgi:DNA-binding transcriptional MerR regulator
VQAAEPERMTIDALAQAAGTTTRNVRAYQTRGLLPAPLVVGRVGYYGDAHLERLRLIANLQERGYSLAAIADLLRAWSERRSVGEMLGFERGPHDERDAELVYEDIIARFPGMTDAQVQRVIDLGLVQPLVDEDGTITRVRVPSPRLLECGQVLLGVGVPLDVVLDELVRLRAHADEIAESLVKMFVDHVIGPWTRAGQPLDQLPDLLDRVRRTKPLPLLAVDAVLSQALEREVGAVLSATFPSRKPG